MKYSRNLSAIAIGICLLLPMSQSSQAQLTNIQRAYCSGSITKDNVRTLGITISGMSALYAGKPIYSGTIRLNGWYGDKAWMLSANVAKMYVVRRSITCPITGKVTDCRVATLETFPTTLTDMSSYNVTGVVTRRTVIAEITLYTPTFPTTLNARGYTSINLYDYNTASPSVRLVSSGAMVPVTYLKAGTISITK